MDIMPKPEIKVEPAEVKAIDETNFMEYWEGHLRSEYIQIMAEMEDTPTGPQAKYLNWNHYFACMFPATPVGKAALEQYIEGMQNLCKQVLDVAPGTRAGREVPSTLPAGPAADDVEAEPVKLNLNLWHLPLHQTGYIRGATNSKHIIENMATFMLSGNKTNMYPIEIAPVLTNCTEGMPLTPCCIGVSVGNAVVMGSHLFVHGVMKHGLWGLCPAGLRRTLAIRLRQCLILGAIWKYTGDLKSAIFDSISSKQAATRRARTSVLGFVAAYGVLVDQDVLKRSQRKSRSELLMEHIKWHNKHEKMRSCRLQNSEIKAMMIIMEWPQGSQALRALTAIWGASHPSQASVTTDMIAADYLDPSKANLVSKDDNPLWHAIFQPKLDVIETYLARCEGTFQYRINDLIKSGKKPNLMNRADSGLP